MVANPPDTQTWQNRWLRLEWNILPSNTNFCADFLRIIGQLGLHATKHSGQQQNLIPKEIWSDVAAVVTWYWPNRDRFPEDYFNKNMIDHLLFKLRTGPIQPPCLGTHRRMLKTRFEHAPNTFCLDARPFRWLQAYLWNLSAIIWTTIFRRTTLLPWLFRGSLWLVWFVFFLFNERFLQTEVGSVQSKQTTYSTTCDEGGSNQNLPPFATYTVQRSTIN